VRTTARSIIVLYFYPMNFLSQTKFWVLCLGVTSLSSCAQQPDFSGNCEAPDHSTWSELLKSHVDSTGWVSYKDFVKDSVKLQTYLSILSSCPPNKNWTENERIAYWINAYNAFTIKLIVDHYPVVSIKDVKRSIPFINSVWNMSFFEIGGKKMNLSEIEHSILRKEFNEPRIHFAIVCASFSCPRLLNEAYEANKLDSQLVLQTKNFINDNNKNEIEADEIRISSIFKWFKDDFTNNGTIQEFIQPFSERDFTRSAKVKYLDYNWSLNGK